MARPSVGLLVENSRNRAQQPSVSTTSLDSKGWRLHGTRHVRLTPSFVHLMTHRNSIVE